MLTQAQLSDFQRALRDQNVLSVYLDGSAADPAVQRSWRLQLDHSFDSLRSWLAESSGDERAKLETCIAHLQHAAASLEPAVGSLGWVAFVTTDGVREAHALPVAVPTLAVWSSGPCVAPYLRALKETRPVVVVVADARKSTLYQYRTGRLRRVDTVRSYHVVERASHMGTPSHPGFHTGPRGTTGRDAAQQSLRTGRDRMIASTVQRVRELANADGWILVGGIKTVASHIAEEVAGAAPGRVLELSSLDVHATSADIAAAARAGASTLRNALDEQRISEIADQAGAHALGALGPVDSIAALEQACVRELFITSRYRENHAAEAERAVRLALDQQASVEEVSGMAAQRLDEYGGMATGLRFRRAPVETVVA